MKYIKIIAKLVLIVLVCFFVLIGLTMKACNDSNSPCGGWPDQIRFGEGISYDGVDYYLYFRTTGLQDKSITFQVYTSEPVFDACNYTDEKLFFWGAYDDFPKKQYVKEFVLQPNGATQDETVKVTYTDDKNDGFASVYTVKFTGIEE